MLVLVVCCQNTRLQNHAGYPSEIVCDLLPSMNSYLRKEFAYILHINVIKIHEGYTSVALQYQCQFFSVSALLNRPDANASSIVHVHVGSCICIPCL